MTKFWKKYKKIFLAVLVISSLVIVGEKFRTEKRGAYSLVRVERGDLRVTVSASGKIKAKNQVDLKFQTSGKLAWVGVQEGERVKKWQAIASLDKEELEKRIGKTMNTYLKQRWDFEQIHEDYGISGKKKEDWLLIEAAKRILEKAQFDLNNSVIEVELADIAAKLATIISPIEGIVTQIETPVAGVNITPTTAVFTVADPGSVIFEVSVDEADISQISLGQKVKITLDAYPAEDFTGKVEKIGFASVITKGGGTAFPIEVSLPTNSDLKFKLGMNGDSEITVQEKKEVLFVPSSALFKKEGKNFVWKAVEEKVIQQEVKIGLETDDSTEVIEGLKEGDGIVSGNRYPSS